MAAGYAPDGKVLAMTGGTASIFGLGMTQSFALAALVVVLGGVIVAARKLLPRVAIEPAFDPSRGRKRLALTINGHRFNWRRRS